MIKSNGEDKRNHLAGGVSIPSVIKEDVIESFKYPAIRFPPQEAEIALNLGSSSRLTRLSFDYTSKITRACHWPFSSQTLKS